MKLASYLARHLRGLPQAPAGATSSTLMSRSGRRRRRALRGAGACRKERERDAAFEPGRVGGEASRPQWRPLQQWPVGRRRPGGRQLGLPLTQALIVPSTMPSTVDTHYARGKDRLRLQTHGQDQARGKTGRYREAGYEVPGARSGSGRRLRCRPPALNQRSVGRLLRRPRLSRKRPDAHGKVRGRPRRGRRGASTAHP